MQNTTFQVNLSVIITNKSGQILLAKRDEKEDIYAGLWGIPGGKMEISDENIETALKREVMEEVGIEIQNIKLISNNAREVDGINKLFMIFSAEIKSGTPKPLDGTAEVKWFTFNEINSDSLTPYIYPIIKKLHT